MMWSYPDTRYYYDWYEGLAPTPAHPADGTIKAAVVDRLRLNPLTTDDDLRVDVKRGVVILQGIVGSRLAKRAAGDDCWDTPGVTDVSNQLEVADAIEQGAGEDPISSIMSTDVPAYLPVIDNLEFSMPRLSVVVSAAQAQPTRRGAEAGPGEGSSQRMVGADNRVAIGLLDGQLAQSSLADGERKSVGG